MLSAAVLEISFYFTLEGLTVLLKVFHFNKNFDRKKVFKMVFISMLERNLHRQEIFVKMLACLLLFQSSAHYWCFFLT